MIIAIIPAHNEEKHIQDVIKETKKMVDKVIVVDDGSSDKTYEFSKKAGALVLKHIVNLGKGAALRTGCKKALEFKPDFLIFIDGDGQHDPKEIKKIVKKLKKGYDLVIGSRKFDKNMPLLMRFGNKLLSLFAKILYGINVKDTQSGYRGVNAKIFNYITWKSNDYFLDTEMLINAKKKGLKIGEITISTIYHDKYKGTTIIDGLRIILKMFFKKILRI